MGVCLTTVRNKQAMCVTKRRGRVKLTKRREDDTRPLYNYYYHYYAPVGLGVGAALAARPSVTGMMALHSMQVIKTPVMSMTT